ncbi:AraC family transcriptional regulator, ethanolamine operon transcriptional activator [Polaromonas sp. YR568]|uniref:helix-turn-helix domain-containing protein n=1 Tax=Polaromonas sp. YR568 TaxID=1855301 RepID=UPI0008E13702|nr:helix-turn-helix domain-containing protein [Polaromonas sp. YR568]SFV02780.1 AraC family transcriptional regulator, ethanolamine operon transcriptional activator [Polaromonas sp. YR568]
MAHPSDTAQPALLSRASFADADEQAAALTGWNQSYLQLSRGAFGGEVRQLEFAGLRLFVESLRESVYQTGQIRDGALALGLPLQVEGPSVFCGAPSDSDALHVFSGASGFEFRSSRRHVMLGLELDEAAWRRCGEHDPALQARLGAQAGLRRLDGAAQAGLRQCLTGVLDTVEAAPALLQSPAVQAAMLDTVMEQLGRVLAPVGGVDSVGAHGHWALTRHAQELVHAQLDQPPTVLALCEQLGVSRRTLQNGFQTALGISPLAYLRAVRLNAARQALKTATSVTAAATDLGFWHFGHFAHDYQQMFGELPSEAFRRYH